MKSGEKKGDWLGTLGAKEWHGGEFPGLSFCLIYSRLGGEEANNLEMSIGTDKNITEKAALYSQRTRKGYPSKTENF